MPEIDKVDRIHFFLCESDYSHGDELTFKIGGFQLCSLTQEPSELAPDEAAVGLWVGERADTSDRIVIIEQDASTLPLLLVIETGNDRRLKADDELHVRLQEVFSGKVARSSQPLGKDVDAGSVSRVTAALEVSDLAPGYYLVVADVRRDGEKLLGGRVGTDDHYIRKSDETMT